MISTSQMHGGSAEGIILCLLINASWIAIEAKRKREAFAPRFIDSIDC
jgi:hypothetical protein